MGPKGGQRVQKLQSKARVMKRQNGVNGRRRGERYQQRGVRKRRRRLGRAWERGQVREREEVM